MEKSMTSVFAAQKAQSLLLRQTDANARITKLKALKQGILRFEEKLYTALQADLRKNRFEAAVTELIFSYAEIDFAIRHLESWMKPRSAPRTATSLFASNKIYHEPKGVCLIIAPWNYPFQLLMSPLISAIAAGNCAMLKPSELSADTAHVIAELITQTFDPKEVACFEGGADVSEALLELPFDHIFFTGSAAIGKKVMQAAAKNLSSVTLELGGKSPAIIDESADLQKAAEKIAWGKLVNAGQTCIAPDYVLVPEKLEAEFIAHYKAAAEKLFFTPQGMINKAVYGKIINRKQFDRLSALMSNAVAAGAELAWGGEGDAEDLTLLPSVLKNVTASNPVMQEEIFGPVMPVIRFRQLQEAIDLVNDRPKPLALYIFSSNKQQTDLVLRATSAGGTCVNDVLVHISNPNLPFGGVNNSGMGSCHGIYGFKSFSHERTVVFQSRWGLTRLLYPPYDAKKGILKLFRKLM